MDFFSWVNRSRYAIRRISILRLWIHILRFLQHRFECQRWRTCVTLPNSGRPVSLRLRVIHSKMEKVNGVHPSPHSVMGSDLKC